MAYNEDSSASGHDEPWIQWFCGLKGHEMFCQVERAYIEDGFNLYGLRACVSNYSDCLDLILDRIGPEDSDDSHLTQSACTLYGLIHARYIVTTHGLDSMYNKYAAKEFGACPLVQCSGQPVLPVGLRDEIGIDTTKIFCPKCKCIYQPTPPIRNYRMSGNGSGGGSGGIYPSSNFGAVDGAAFGTTFPHLFLMTFNNLVPDPPLPDSAYIPRVFGFRVHHSALVRQGGGGGGGAYAALANNGRRGGGTSAAATYSQRNLGNVSSTRATAGSSRSNGGGGFAGLPIQDGVVNDEGREGNSNNKEGDVGAVSKKADSGLEEGVPTEVGEAAAGATARTVDEIDVKTEPIADNGDSGTNPSKKRELTDEGKRSGSSSGSKRPRRGGEAGT
ncbi:hypothetical protein ACHAXH_005869 [Discostella pseudostelligera]